MATEIKMPQLSDTMHAGKILSWQKSEGESVERGDILAEVETDKANLEIESFHQGVLLKIAVPAGAAAQVGEAIAYIGEPGEEISESSQEIPIEKHDHSGAVQQDAAAGSTESPPLMPSLAHERIKASPLARNIARLKNIALAGIQGSGPGGRIVKKDVESAAAADHSADTSAQGRPRHTNPTPSQPSLTEGTLSPLSKMRETIGRRMQQSVVEAPHFYVTTAIDMRAAARLRATLREREELQALSLNHLVVCAAAYALARERSVNSSIRDGQLYEPNVINIGVVTAAKEGLLIPVIHSADKLNLQDCVFEVNAAIERVRAGRPTAQDLSGGTFTISNMGMFDVENFTAIISPGQGAILAVSSAQEAPIVDKGQLAVGLTMKATLSADHRVIDGIMAAKFLGHFKAALQEPALMFI